MADTSLSRRFFLRSAAATTLAATSLGQSKSALPNAEDAVQLSQIHGPSEQDELAPGPFLAKDQRIGLAIVGLGRLSIDQILPAFGKSKYAKVTALVSGDHEKARKIAAQYGVKQSGIYDYANFERLRDNPEVRIIYIVLPNSMHAEFVERGAKIGKHILCEKPMATSSREAEQMIAACNAANEVDDCLSPTV